MALRIKVNISSSGDPIQWVPEYLTINPKPKPWFSLEKWHIDYADDIAEYANKKKITDNVRNVSHIRIPYKTP